MRPGGSMPRLLRLGQRHAQFHGERQRPPLGFQFQGMQRPLPHGNAPEQNGRQGGKQGGVDLRSRSDAAETVTR